MLAKACDLGFAKGCYYGGFLYENSKENNQNYIKARELYIKGCDLKDGASCGSAGYLYRYGKGVEKSNKTAEKYFKKACEIDALDCETYETFKKLGY